VGLDAGKYVAYCFDQATTFFGNWVESELDKVKVGKASKSDRETQALVAARKRRLEAILGPEEEQAKRKFADPADFLA
jgi:hypothetical protein